MSIRRSSTLRDIAFEVCTALNAVGATAVLTGGSAATVHSEGAYQSCDLDYVLTSTADGAVRALAELGYCLEGQTYTHPESEFTLDFPPGPLTVGGDLVSNWETLREGSRLLHILTPTDSCRDRLAGFLYWNDRGSLEQALLVARAKKSEIDFEVIRFWCEREGRLDQHREFMERVGRFS